MLRPFGRRTDKVRMWPSIKAGAETIIRAIMERSLAKAEGSSPRARAAWARGFRSGMGLSEGFALTGRYPGGGFQPPAKLGLGHLVEAPVRFAALRCFSGVRDAQPGHLAPGLWAG